MHCTLLRSKSHTPEGAERENSFLSRKSVEKQSFDNSKGSEVSTVGLRDSNQRCAILTFFSVEPYGQWNIVAVPLEHGSHPNKLGSATTGSSANGHQSHDHGNRNKEEKSRKRSSRKKMKKKGKQTKQISEVSGLSDVECSVGGLTSETGEHDFIHDRVAPLPCASKLADSASNDVCNGIYSEGSSSRGYECIPCIEEVDVSEALIPYVQPISSSEQHLSGLEAGIQTSEVHDTKCELISSSNVGSGTNDCLVLYSTSPVSNFGNSLSCDNENAQHSKENPWIDLPNSPGCAAGEGCYSPGSLLNGIAATDDHGQKTNYNEEACRSEIINKRAKKIKRVSQNSTGCRGSSVGNMHGHLGRENNRSVWQKVHKNDTCERNYNSKNVDSVFSQFNNKLKEAPSPKNQINFYCSNLKSESEVKKQEISKFCGKMKRKSKGIKQEFDYHCRKGPQAFEGCPNQCEKVYVQLTESCSIPAEMNGENRPEAVSISHSNSTFARSRLPTDTIKSIALKPLQSSQACLNDEELLGNVYATSSRLDDQNENNKTMSTIKSCNSTDTSKMLEKLSAVQLDTLDHEGSKTDKNVSHADHKNDTRSGAISQNMISIVVETTDSLDLSLYSDLYIEKPDEEAGGDRTLRTSTVDESASDSPSSVCEMNASGTCICPSMSGVISLSSNNVAQLKNLGNENTPIAKELDSNFGSAQCLISESEKQIMSTSNRDSWKILSVVNDSQRAQLSSEAIHLATGCPIAEFEKLLHSASPVICPSINIISCQTCFCSSVGRASLCQHEMPNISLFELWQWYEKQGSYGLEVRAEDHEKSNRLGMDSVSFRAYFVPYLSAVQLFAKRKACEDNRNEIPDSSAIKDSNTFKATKVSNFGCLPTFSLLDPQSKAEGAMSNSGPSAESSTDSQSISPAESGWSDNFDLLFEYFESEQPQKRRPLFEMIKELVRGDISPQGRAYGDATILSSVCLNDLHPRSWYSVAWYPVYRIPEANFRASFLTYHSLGHLVHRTLSLDSTGTDTCVVSPVVGLQSYNAQGECWFQPRHSAGVMNSNPSEILKDRLRTLEEAASVLARAVVTKGKETSMNMQPDYEFFLSRRR